MLSPAAEAATRPAGLPTLLASRPCFGEARKPTTPSFSGPGLPLIKAVDEASAPARGGAGRLRVRNTFIETADQRSPSLERFFKERQVQTCPSSRVGIVARSLQEFASVDIAAADEADCASHARFAESPLVGRGVAGGCGARAAVHNEEASALRGAAPDTAAADALAAYPNSKPNYPSAVPAGAAAGALPAYPIPKPTSAIVSRTRACAPREPPTFVDWGRASALIALGGSALPSPGSALHAARRCKPCAFYHSDTCQNGEGCAFCHLCEPGEKRRRRKEKVEMRRCERRARQASSGNWR